jgi:hypothetical protein
MDEGKRIIDLTLESDDENVAEQKQKQLPVSNSNNGDDEELQIVDYRNPNRVDIDLTSSSSNFANSSNGNNNYKDYKNIAISNGSGGSLAQAYIGDKRLLGLTVMRMLTFSSVRLDSGQLSGVYLKKEVGQISGNSILVLNLHQVPIGYLDLSSMQSLSRLFDDQVTMQNLLVQALIDTRPKVSPIPYPLFQSVQCLARLMWHVRECWGRIHTSCCWRFMRTKQIVKFCCAFCGLIACQLYLRNSTKMVLISYIICNNSNNNSIRLNYVPLDSNRLI